MKPFESIIPRDFQGGVLVLKDGQVVFEYCQGNADHSTNTPFTSHTMVTYNNGNSEDIVTALNAGRATIADLDEFGIEYHTEPKQ